MKYIEQNPKIKSRGNPGGRWIIKGTEILMDVIEGLFQLKTPIEYIISDYYPHLTEDQINGAMKEFREIYPIIG